MKKLYYINTKNDYGQILFFTSKQAATKWAKIATRWDDEEINEKIKYIEQSKNGGYFSLFV